MRLLLLGTEIRDLGQVKNFSGVYSFFLARALREAGADIVFADPEPALAAYRMLDLAGVDHVIGLHSRHFDRIPPACLRLLRMRFRGAITHLSDRPLSNHGVDCTFCARDAEGRPGNHHIGWAADPELCRPAQQPGELSILVDHADYVGDRGWDKSAVIKREVRALLRSSRLWAKRFDRVSVFEMADGAIVPCDLENVRPFNRRHVPYAEACAAYRRASVYLVTHRESLGLTVLETAMCGALPVAPRGFVQPDRLRTVRHVEYEGAIPWPAVLEAIDVGTSRKVAMENSWGAVAGRMLGWFGGFGK